MRPILLQREAAGKANSPARADLATPIHHIKQQRLPAVFAVSASGTLKPQLRLLGVGRVVLDRQSLPPQLFGHRPGRVRSGEGVQQQVARLLLYT